MTAICPCCGYDLQAERAVEFGALAYQPRYGVTFGGVRLEMSPQCHELLGTLMRAARQVLPRSAIQDRLGIGSGRDNSFAVQLCRVRAALRAVGVPDVVSSIYGEGVRFDPAPLVQPAPAHRTTLAGAST